MKFRRLIKQLIYGILYLLLISGVFYIIYLGGLKPAPSCFDNKQNQGEEEVDCGGPCETCATRYLNPLEASRAVLIDSPIDGESILIFQLENSNPHFGADSLDYKVSLYPDRQASSTAVAQAQDKSFIYPGELKNIVLTGIKTTPEQVQNIDIQVENVDWLPRETYSRPETIVRSVEMELRDEGSLRPKVAVSGIVRNENAYDLSQVSVSIQISTELGRVSIASKASIGAIEGFTDKEFEIIIPLRPNQILDLNQQPRITVEAKR